MQDFDAALLAIGQGHYAYTCFVSLLCRRLHSHVPQLCGLIFLRVFFLRNRLVDVRLEEVVNVLGEMVHIPRILIQRRLYGYRPLHWADGPTGRELPLLRLTETLVALHHRFVLVSQVHLGLIPQLNDALQVIRDLVHQLSVVGV